MNRMKGEGGGGGGQTDKKNERMKREGGEKYMQYTHVDNVLVIVTSTRFRYCTQLFAYTYYSNPLQYTPPYQSSDTQELLQK